MRESAKANSGDIEGPLQPPPADAAAPSAIVGRGERFAALLLMALLVSAAMMFLLTFRYGVIGQVATLATLLPVGYAFAAGMVSSVNPCGFFMLPAYVSYQLGTEEQGFYESAVYIRFLRAILVALVATAGFIAVFSLIGYIIALGGRWLITVFPYAGMVIGVALVSLGMWLLISHKPLGITAAGRVGVTPRKNLRNVFLFGASYGVCSLSCTLPVFLVVVGSALATKGFGASLGQFISYSLGMGLILTAVTVGSALFKDATARFLKGLLPYIHTLSALFLVGAGIYVVYYWISYGDIF